MKILAFADIHGSLSALKKIKKKAKKADIILCGGDVSVFEQELDYLVLMLNKIGKPLLIVHGNHEGSKDMKNIASLFKNIDFIHKKTKKIGNCLFLGYGGGGFSMTDSEFVKISRKFSKEIKKHRKENKKLKVILLTHAPPYDTKLDLIVNEHCGNKDFKKFIENENIDLVISGHIHETANADYTSKKTRYVNPGPYGKVIEL